VTHFVHATVDGKKAFAMLIGVVDVGPLFNDLL
jgi:hypothetical protein